MPHDGNPYPTLPLDRELEAQASALSTQFSDHVTLEMVPHLRAALAAAPDPTPELLAAAGLTQRDVTIKGYEGVDLEATVIARADHEGHGPGLYHLHGGGMTVGHRKLGVPAFIPWVVEHDAVLVTVDYRLSPEFPDPYPVEDSYAGLVWTAEHADELGIDPDRIVVLGQSAGACLSAGTALLARDRQGPRLLGQVLCYPMLDDRHETVSADQCADGLIWTRASSETAWDAYLGEQRASGNISYYAAPSRATDLSGLPPAYIDCGSNELFRDENIAYANELWKAGVQTELHVWAGGFHGFDMIATDTTVVDAAHAARASWIARVLGS
ncbi:alpha/beta hydrolase family protein [Nocardia nova SH22a]|uniref:Alpha/beta hydrolase family protein n=1 Tax=Nocardia nova SH22a TaxID=1415166 RepID=W5TGR0_9NOCA|nr:alpha/beta hydrolase [Nocardia nova]AHH18382.1 alpha/beta hydrolase family protein [Nocardia nova SH22a]